MQVVIDIPEKEYELCRKYYGHLGDHKVISYAIVNGTPLDKHDEEVIKETVESIWGKPPYIELLDKISAEIDQKQYDFMDSKDYDEGVRFGLMLAYQIIDKYTAERKG